MNENYNQQNGQFQQPYQQNGQYQQPQYQQQFQQDPQFQQYQQYPQYNNMYQPPVKEGFFKRIHTDKFHWTDQFILISFLSYILLAIGQILGQIVVGGLFYSQLYYYDADGFFSITVMYLTFIGIWMVFALYMAAVPKNRPLLSIVTTKVKGNNFLLLMLGLLIGFGTNMVCAIGAMLHKDISIYYDSFPILQLIILFCAVFIQSSAEELVCRGFLYQRLRKGYKHPAVAIIINSAFFAALHLGNDGVGPLAILDIFVTGIFFSMMVYYLDSLWCAMAAHAAWNYTQNIILGLPNSGIVSPFSIYKLDAAAATNSFAYNVDFGLEGTVLAVSVQIIGCVVLYLLFRDKKVNSYDPWH